MPNRLGCETVRRRARHQDVDVGTQPGAEAGDPGEVEGCALEEHHRGAEALGHPRNLAVHAALQRGVEARSLVRSAEKSRRLRPQLVGDEVSGSPRGDAPQEVEGCAQVDRPGRVDRGDVSQPGARGGESSRQEPPGLGRHLHPGRFEPDTAPHER